MKCKICESELRFQWCDTHGVGVCISCGLPYRIYHYEGERGKEERVDKPPETTVKPEWIEIAKKYYNETAGMVFPGDFDMGFLGGRSATYSGATQNDIDTWYSWLEKHESGLPKSA